MKITQLSRALPKEEYSTEEMMKEFPCELPDAVAQNVLNLGVKKRCIISQGKPGEEQEAFVDDTGLVDLCAQACKEATKKAGLLPQDVSYLITAYDANPFLSPGLSQMLAPRLGLDAYVRHVNVQGIASTAFTKTLQLADDYLNLHDQDNVLICVSGVSSYWFQSQVQGLTNVMEIGKISSIADVGKKQVELWKWVATMEYFLFGDGVAAAIVSNKGSGLEVGRIVEVTNIDEKDRMAGYARLSPLNEPFKLGFHSHLGKEIPDLGVKYTSLALDRLFGKDAAAKARNAKKWAVHTGSEKILDALAERHGAEKEQLSESHEVLRDCGNLAGASLPFILERIVTTNKFTSKDTILLLAYGWGFSASAGLLEVHQ